MIFDAARDVVRSMFQRLQVCSKKADRDSTPVWEAELAAKEFVVTSEERGRLGGPYFSVHEAIDDAERALVDEKEGGRIWIRGTGVRGSRFLAEWRKPNDKKGVKRRH